MAVLRAYSFDTYGPDGTTLQSIMAADGWLEADGVETDNAFVADGAFSLFMGAGDEVRYRLQTDPATVGTSFKWRVQGTPALTDDICFFQYNDGAAHNDQITIGRDLSNRVLIKRGSTVLAQSEPNVVLILGWNTFQIKTKIDNTNGEVIVKHNNLIVASVSGVDTRNHASADICNQITFVRGSFDKNIDSVVFWDTTGSVNNDFLPGDTNLATLLPNGAGDSAQWTVSGAAANWQAVDEGIPDGDTTYNTSATPNDLDLFTFEDLPTEANSVYAVRAVVYARRVEGGASQIRICAKLSTTTIKSDPINLAIGYQRYDWIFETKPGGGNWTPSDVNSAQFGYEFV